MPIGCDRPGASPLIPDRSEQGKLPAAKAFRLAERDKHMSEQKSFMQQLDEWTDATVINPLVYAFAEDDEEAWQRQGQLIKKAIREKVLESYHNGQAAGPRPATPARKDWRNAQAKTR